MGKHAPGRRTLAAAAVGAAALYQFLLLFPLALMFGLPALWFGNSFLLLASAAGFVVMAWVVQPGSVAPPPALPRDAAPALYRMADEVAERLNAPHVHAIALDDEFNAAALELNRGFSLRPTRRVLILGRPLLALLDAEALSAVVAHEFGHFSRQHGRLGHWLYRTRLAWMAYADAADEPDLSAWERAGVAFAQRFVPWFARASFEHARRDEYEADALAAQACGAAALARALQQMDAAAARWHAVHEALRSELQTQHAEPPADWLLQLAQRLRERAVATLADPAHDSDPHATHPSTAARLQALQLAPAAALDWPAADACAGAVWLETRWAEEAVDSRWATPAARHAWRCWHTLRRHGARLHEPSTESALRFHLAQAQLAAGGDAAAAARGELRALLEAAPSWALPVRRALVAHASALQLSAAERAENLALLQRAQTRCEAAAERMREARRRGEFGPPPLSPAARTALADALAAHPALQAAWCVGLETQLDERRRYRGIALVLRALPERLAADAIGDDELTDSAGELLASLCDADLIVMVPVRYATESVPEEFATRPEALLFSR